ncbi:antitoxin of toxin-antitoxin stability system [Pseudomonas daroniae]|uniref:Antitoxin of toxin-antitoxin stability system n=1 Tax=Phytopseudomonas daroniae TaxID=2487519 RepID=A0A4Q9QRB4_9GAMM|nr:MULTISPECIES: antitoxin of toxin-antitoxin stability system [Pseudomonas]TBU83472.1 antitoxin of toxin-antitoxin stability system [Pseudomonas daroniae]TBU85111.1 antitoxin of toxin-antitoxin stability system [Pseudomonas sp. FRB 228]TBU93596.1 antitoxin of toxin-antitoxin stability system [Pseudomonas daroniae]
MAKEAVFNLKLEPELREGFMAAAQAVHLPASQVMRDLMRDFIRQQQAKEHDEFVQRKVAVVTRASVEAGRGRANEDVEAAFAARRAKALGHE